MYNDGRGLPCMNHQTILTIEILLEKLVYTLKSDVFLGNDPFSFWGKRPIFSEFENEWLPGRCEFFGFGEGKYHSLVQ